MQHTSQHPLCAPSLVPPPQVLLLGCGDVRNALRTASALASAGAASIALHLNDCSDCALSRAALLLHLAEVLDPTSRDDVGFLFDVWFCGMMSAQHALRLRGVLRELIEGAAGARVAFEELGCGGIAEASTSTNSGSSSTAGRTTGSSNSSSTNGVTEAAGSAGCSSGQSDGHPGGALRMRVEGVWRAWMQLEGSGASVQAER